jgi:hypothetical protein
VLREDWFEGPAEREAFAELVRHSAQPLEDVGEALLELSAEPPDEGLGEDQAVALAAALEERRLKREVVRLRESVRDLPAAEERRQRMSEILGLEARIQDLKGRAGEALLQLIEEAIRNSDGGAAPPQGPCRKDRDIP